MIGPQVRQRMDVSAGTAELNDKHSIVAMTTSGQCTRKETGHGAAGDQKRTQKLWNLQRLLVAVATCGQPPGC